MPKADHDLREVLDEALSLWLGIGKDWAEFWSATPKIVGAIVGAVQKRQHQSILIQAWYNEYMARQKRLKGLSSYLKEPKTLKPLKKGDPMEAGPWLALFGGGEKSTPQSPPA